MARPPGRRPYQRELWPWRITDHRCVHHAAEPRSLAPHAGFSGARADGDHLIERGQLENPGHFPAGADELQPATVRTEFPVGLDDLMEGGRVDEREPGDIH